MWARVRVGTVKGASRGMSTVTLQGDGITVPVSSVTGRMRHAVRPGQLVDVQFDGDEYPVCIIADGKAVWP